MLLGTLRAIRRYPVKSLGGEALETATVLPNGLEGDRVAALINDDGARTGKPARGKEHNRLHLQHTIEDAMRLASAVHLERDADSRFFDLAPISLILDRWLDGVSDDVGYRVEWERFRPNFYIEASDGIALEEAELVDRDLRLGEVRLRVREPIERCVVPSYDLHGGAADPRVQRYVVQSRANVMGIYCDVPRAGIARIGDSLELIDF